MLTRTGRPCRLKRDHRHAVRYPGGRVVDRCRSLHLWSTVAFHVLAGEEVLLDGAPFTGRERWAGEYLDALTADPLTAGTARRLRAALKRRQERRS